MALRFHLYNDSLGPLTVVNDPIGINDLTQTTKRSEDWEGVLFQIVFDVEFIKEGRDYIKRAYESDGGIDAVVNVSLYNRHPNTRRWEHYGTGRINYNKFDLSDETVIVNIEQTGLQLNIMNLMETHVDLEGLISQNGGVLPAPQLHEPVFHSKTLVKQSQLGPNDDAELPFPSALTFKIDRNADPMPIGTVMYIPVDTSKVKFEEIIETFPTPSQAEPFPVQHAGQLYISGGTPDLVNPNNPGTESDYIVFLNHEERKAFRFPQIKPQEKAVSQIDIQVRARAKVFAYGTGGAITVDGELNNRIGRVEMIAWFERRGSVNQIKEIGRWDVTEQIEVEDTRDIPYKVVRYVDSNIASEVGDEFFVFLTIRVYGWYDIRTNTAQGEITHDFYVQYDAEHTWVNISSATFFEESKHKIHLIYDAVKRCCQYYTNVDDCFHSTLLGRTDLGYAVDGEASLIGITSGNKLRGYDDKHVLINLKTILDFLKARYCIGFGFELIDGKFKFVIEHISYFYKKNVRALSLGKVYPIKRILMPEYFYNSVEIGYSGKLDIGQYNGIDEFNTFRRYSLPIVNTKNKLILLTSLRAAGSQIEWQRRLANTTIDSKLDDENFLVCLVREGEGFRTKSNQGYESVNNVRFPDLQYNLDISPGRMIKAWVPVIGACLIRSKSKLLKFTHGEVNYKVTSKKIGEGTVLESGDIDLSGTEPIFDNEQYGFTIKLSADQQKIVHSNPFATFEFEDRFGNKMEGFIDAKGGIENNPNSKVTSFSLRRVNRKVLSVSTEKPKWLVPGIEFGDISKGDYGPLKGSEAPSTLLSRLIKFIKI